MMIFFPLHAGYFEQKAIEHQIDAQKPLIMKRAVYNARRNMRAKSVRLIRRSGKICPIVKSGP